MEKILFYVNSVDELKPLAPVLNKLNSEGVEVAFCTDNFKLVMLLPELKQLLVAIGSYEPDLLVSDTPISKVSAPRITFDELRGVISEES